MQKINIFEFTFTYDKNAIKVEHQNAIEKSLEILRNNMSNYIKVHFFYSE